MMFYLTPRQWRLLRALDELSLWLWPWRMRQRLRDAEAHVSNLRNQLAAERLAFSVLLEREIHRPDPSRDPSGPSARGRAA